MVEIGQKQDKKADEKVKEIIFDYEKRKEARRVKEQSWLININFLMGNQYACVLPSGEIGVDNTENGSREVFNHIAPIVESRLAKLGKVRPSVSTRPASGSEKDKEVARLTKAVIDAVSSDINLPNLIKKATVWSEVTGTSYYKILVENTTQDGFETTESGNNGNAQAENLNLGEKLAGKIEGGDIKLRVCVISPFEIYPLDPSEEDLSLNPSIIHARAIRREDAEQTYGLTGLVGTSYKSLTSDQFFAGTTFFGGKSNAPVSLEVEKEDQVLVIERYTKNIDGGGRLEIVVGDRLVYDGDMPFDDYPFVKQISASSLGSFYGVSIIDRCVPVQRAYNAVKNRKIEYLSRLTTGISVVEEGSVDVDDLIDGGLTPGKVVVYRAGANPPRMMETPTLPPELSREEDRLLNELITLTGVSELMRNSMLPSNVTSGTAINLLSEADDNRLSVAAEQIRESVLKLIKFILNVFKKQVNNKRISKLYDEKGQVQLYYWKGSDLSCEDVVLDTENELTNSFSQRKQMVIDLFKMGLFNGENGKIEPKDKAKILDMIGFGSFDGAYSLSEEHLNRAKKENISGEFFVLEVDDHSVHIAEHTRRAIEIAGESEGGICEDKIMPIIEHIREHKTFMKAASVIGGGI